MAIAGLGFSCRNSFPARLPAIYCIRRVSLLSPSSSSAICSSSNELLFSSRLFSCLQVRRRSITANETITEPRTSLLMGNNHEYLPSKKKVNSVDEGPDWKKLSTKELGITNDKISKPTRLVLNALRKKGYQVYLVGGCVRDLILKKTPKDFDVLTSAELKEVVRTFSQCQIVGRRFPICHVHVDQTIVEVSSFSTSSRKSNNDRSKVFKRPRGCDIQDFLRWRNCLARDFTINGLMLDPYSKLVYDYLGGMEDIRRAKVRTVIPADNSFREDCARILRAVRIAARLGFRFSKETAQSIKDLSSSILRLDKGRVYMEMNYMLAYGSAEASLRLLWKIGLLELLLPIQAAYFVSQGFRRRDKRSNMLLALFSRLDRLLSPDRPCHGSLWIAILAFHKALVDHPRDPLVIAVFSLAIYNGGNTSEALEIANSISQPHDPSFHELIGTQELKSNAELMYEVRDFATAVQAALSTMTDGHFVSQAMAEYPQAPQSNLVFISMQLYLWVSRIFDCVKSGKEKGWKANPGKKIDYESLAMGNTHEVRQAFARVVFDTVYPLDIRKEGTS